MKEIVRLKEKIGSNEQQYAILHEEFIRFQEITNKEHDIYNKERDFMREVRYIYRIWIIYVYLKIPLYIEIVPNNAHTLKCRL